MNCLPFLGLESKVRVMGGFSVTIYDRSVREMACGLFERGLGYKAAARRLGIPPRAVRKWQQMYRAVGRGGLLGMGRAKARYDYGTKVAAARAVVDGGAEALRPKPKGRPRGSGSRAAPATREEELERKVRRLEAEVAYLKKSIALKAELRSRAGRRP